MNDNILNFDRDRYTEPHWGARADDYFDHDEYATRDLGDYTEIVVMDGRVIDVRTHRAGGSEYECAAMELGRGKPKTPPPPPPAPPRAARHEQILTWLSLVVGGDEHLRALACEPLPAEDLDLTDLRADLRERLVAIDRELTRVTELVLGPEVRTAARRLLVRAVAAQPALLRGVAGDEVMACAALTAVAKANDLVGQGRVVPVTLLRTLFNLRSAPNDKVQSMTRAVAPQTSLLSGWERPILDVPILGTPDLLVGSFREGVIVARDAGLRLRAATPDQASPVLG
ncbi:hypothetical protein ACOCJ7_19480 [Knoellia sp. CPCC 206453]|uniref:hypothetical protein n=1 Tax=Knoellia pratensis TaxID=3404796 RepID=UPI00360DAF61